MGLRVLPSAANHVLIVDMDNVEAIDRLMNERGFIGRPTGSSFGLPNGYRVTVGTAEQNRQFVSHLAAVLETVRIKAIQPISRTSVGIQRAAPAVPAVL